MKLCSACLLGFNCRYNGKNKINAKVLELSKSETLIPICPEQLAGLSTPRNPTEIVNGKIIENTGLDVIAIYNNGVTEAMKVLDIYQIDSAILKQNSPTCGCGKIYDGSFTGKTISGDGIFTKALKQKGINVISEEEL